MGLCKLMKFNRAKCKVLCLVGKTQNQNTGWEKNGLRADGKRGTWSCWWMRNSMPPNTVHLQSRKPTVSWAANLKKHGQHVQERLCPSILLSWDLRYFIQLWELQYKNAISQREWIQRRDMKMISELEYFSYEDRLSVFNFREIVESMSLEVLKARLEGVLRNFV